MFVEVCHRAKWGTCRCHHDYKDVMFGQVSHHHILLLGIVEIDSRYQVEVPTAWHVPSDRDLGNAAFTATELNYIHTPVARIEDVKHIGETMSMHTQWLLQLLGGRRSVRTEETEVCETIP